MNTRPIRVGLNALLACLLAIAAALTGFGMGAQARGAQPAHTASVIEIVICSSDGQRIVRIDASGQAVSGDTDPDRSMPCCTDLCLDCALCSPMAGNTANAVHLPRPAPSQAASVWNAVRAPDGVATRASQRAPPRIGS